MTHLGLNEYALSSLAAEVFWLQPVIKSDFPPADPKVWDETQGNPGHVIRISGIWTVFDRKAVMKVVDLYKAEVFGEVHLWGRVAKHELGYRAEWCMIRKLYFMSDEVTLDARQVKSIVNSLERRYGCDVEIV